MSVADQIERLRSKGMEWSAVAKELGATSGEAVRCMYRRVRKSSSPKGELSTESIERDRMVHRLQQDARRWRSLCHELREENRTLAEAMEFSKSLPAQAPPEPNWSKVKEKGEATAILVLSDWHIEERVDPATIGDLNAYDIKIAEKRAKRVFEGAAMMIDIARSLSNIKQVCVALLGDFFSGYIHEELEESNAMSPLEAASTAQDWLLSGLQFLRKQTGCQLIVPCVHGNHGRVHKKPRVATAAQNSFEFHMYRQMERIARMSKWRWCDFQVAGGYLHWITLNQRRVRVQHGHAIKYGGGVGGITIPVNKALASWNAERGAPDLDLFGHFHQFVAQPKWICNGSLIGYSPYGQWVKGTPEPPSQTLAVVSRKRGLVFAERIFVE